MPVWEMSNRAGDNSFAPLLISGFVFAIDPTLPHGLYISPIERECLSREEAAVMHTAATVLCYDIILPLLLEL